MRPASSPVRAVHGIRTACDLIVMPRSRSMSMRSRYCARMAAASTTSVSCSIRSASVDLPWSMWAMMQKFRMIAGSVLPGCGAAGRARAGTRTLPGTGAGRSPFSHVADAGPCRPVDRHVAVQWPHGRAPLAGRRPSRCRTAAPPDGSSGSTCPPTSARWSRASSARRSSGRSPRAPGSPPASPPARPARTAAGSSSRPPASRRSGRSRRRTPRRRASCSAPARDAAGPAAAVGRTRTTGGWCSARARRRAQRPRRPWQPDELDRCLATLDRASHEVTRAPCPPGCRPGAAARGPADAPHRLGRTSRRRSRTWPHLDEVARARPLLRDAAGRRPPRPRRRPGRQLPPRRRRADPALRLELAGARPGVGRRRRPARHRPRRRARRRRAPRRSTRWPRRRPPTTSTPGSRRSAATWSRRTPGRSRRRRRSSGCTGAGGPRRPGRGCPSAAAGAEFPAAVTIWASARPLLE